MRAEGGSPNLINGVSRQPAEIRLTSQLEESVNQFPTITRGLVPRNPAILKGRIEGTNPSNATVHLIDRDEAEQYVVTISPGGIQVHDLAGNPKVVSAPNGYGYLAGAQQGDLEALTVADHTFIVNKRRIVGTSPLKTPAFQNAGLVHIVQGDYFTDFKISVDGVVKARYKTQGGPFSQEAEARAAEAGARPAMIAHQLLHGEAPEGSDPSAPANATSALVNTLGTTDWSFELLDNVIYIKRNSATAFSLDIEAGSENRARAHKEVSQDFSELPRRAPNGFSIKVSGSEETAYDDYYVRFDHPSGAAQGRWKETVGPNIPYRLDASTMPHLLVRNSDGTFTFKEAEWADREVGDLETNPWPSFVGYTIDGMVFFKNRVGFISGEAVAMSRHGSFFNFFIESILTPLDTDPVDVAVSFPEVSNIHHAVPFSGEMIMFTSSVPFRLASGELFTPKSANFEHVMSNRVSAKVRPVVAGSRLYFVNDAPSGCFVHEFVYDREVGVKEAPTITDHVNGYIPSGVTMMEVDEDLKVLALVSPNDPTAVYVYKWLWIGREKAQSAWQKWVLPDDIIGMRFYGEELVLVTSRADGREVLSVNCHEAWQDDVSTIYLDRRREVQGVYDAATDHTTFDLGFNTTGAKLVLRDGDDFGLQPGPLTYAGNTILVEGDHAKWAYIGWPYESYGELSPILYRPQSGDGSYGNAHPGFKTSVASVTFATDATAFLAVDVLRDYRSPYDYYFSAALVGTKTGAVGSLIVGEVKKAASVMSKSEDVTIRFGSREPYAYAVLSYQWTGRADPLAY